MNSLDDWIEKVRNCPDGEVIDKSCPSRTISRLTAECGIYDNWDIFVKGNLEKIAQDLIDSGKFATYNIQKMEQGYWLGPRRGIWASKIGWKLRGIKKFMMKITGEAKRTQNHRLVYTPGTVLLQVQYTPSIDDEHNLTLKFHPYQPLKGLGQKMPGVSDDRAMSFAIFDVIDYLKKSSLPFCIPHYSGWNNMNFNEYNLEDIPKPLLWPEKIGGER